MSLLSALRPADESDLYDNWRASVNASAIASKWSAYAIDVLPEKTRAWLGESLDAVLTKAFDAALSEMWAREVDACADIAEIGEELGVCERWPSFRGKAGAL
jgi:hypothetical protein